jgi:RHS repeat-associated protein
LTPTDAASIPGSVYTNDGATNCMTYGAADFGYVPPGLKYAGAWLQTNAVRYVYDGNLVLQERWLDLQPANSNLQQSVTYTRGRDLSGSLEGAGGIGGLLARSDSGLWTLDSGHRTSASVAFYHCDGNGNITCLINSNQAIVAKYLYDPYGSFISISGPLAEANLYRFSSKEAHGISGMLYYLYRYCEQGLQRWVNRDPIHEFGFLNLKGGKLGFHTGSELNLYCFVGNASVNYLDFVGLKKRFGGLTGGKCCNDSKNKNDEWWLDDGVWHKLSPGECTGLWDDCDGMTCSGGFYYLEELDGASCKHPGVDCPYYERRRWTPTKQGPTARSPHNRGAPDNDPPPGYGWSTL